MTTADKLTDADKRLKDANKYAADAYLNRKVVIRDAHRDGMSVSQIAARLKTDPKAIAVIIAMSPSEALRLAESVADTQAGSCVASPANVPQRAVQRQARPPRHKQSYRNS